MFDWGSAAKIAESTSKTLAVVIGGMWVFWRYVYQGEFKKRIAFSVDVNFVAVVEDSWCVELVALLDNKGFVTHNITEFTFKLRSINGDDPVGDAGEQANFQVNFPHRVKEGSWLPKNWGNTFVRPGICNRYTFVTDVPTKAAAVLLNGRFNYSGKDAFHTASRLVKVPTTAETNLSNSRY